MVLFPSNYKFAVKNSQKQQAAVATKIQPVQTQVPGGS